MMVAEDLPPWAAALLDAASIADARPLAGHADDVRVLRFTPAVDARCSEPLSRDPLVAKRYMNNSGTVAVGAMTALHQALSVVQDSTLRVPRVVEWHPNRRVLIQEHVPGRCLFEWLEADDREVPLERTGVALAELHGLSMPMGCVADVGDHLRDLMRPMHGELAERLPSEAQQIATIVAELRRSEARVSPSVLPCPVHRDWHARQAFLTDSHVWVVDWDSFAWGDPALDVGNFLVYLETHVTREPERAVAAVLRGYARVGDHRVLDRLPCFKALTYLRLACKACRLQQPRWHARVRLMLECAERALR